MATANVALNVTGNATQQLQRVQKQVDNLGRSFGTLRNALGGIAFGAFFANVLRSADAMDDLAKATGLSIATIDGFGAALQQSGGDANDAATMLAKLSQQIEEGKQGTAQAEYQFNKLGISLQEVRTLSEEDIFRKVIAGLAKMPAGAERTALALQFVGKNAKSIDWNNLNGSLDAFISKAEKAAPGTKALAQLYGNLQGIGKSFTQQLTVGGANFAETLAKLTQNTDAIAKALVELTKIVTMASIAFALMTKVIPGLKTLRNVIAEFGTISAFKEISRDVDLITKNWKRFTGALGHTKEGMTYVKSLGISLANVGILLTRLGGYAYIIYTIGEAFKALTGTINPVAKAFEFLRDVGVIALARLKKEWDSLVESFKAWTELLGLRSAIEFVAQSIVPLFSGPLDWLEQKLQDIGKYWRQTVTEAESSLGIGPDFTKPLVIEGQGAEAMPKDYFKEGRKRKEEEAKAQATELEKLAQSIRNTTNEFIKQRDAQLAALQIGASYNVMSERQRGIVDAQREVYDQFTTKIEEYRNKIAELPPEQQKLAGTYLEQIAILERLRNEQMLQATEAVNATHDQIEAQLQLQSELRKTFDEYRAGAALDDLQAELDLLGLEGDELERQQRILATQQEMRDSVMATMEQLIALEEKYGNNKDANYEREKSELEKQLDIARQVAEGKIAIDEEYFKRKQELEDSYTAGAEKALKGIAEQFKPINMAQEAVQKTWGHISDAVDTFVETGKFKFSDFARSIIADLAKMIAKAMIFKAIQTALGAFGLSIPGLANGGPAKGGQPYIVGERGPELFVPQGNGTVVPNNRLQGAQNGVATGAVNAPVTNNYNTYNINALDAKSVAQLFAENRKAIFGANKMAEREMSYAGAR